MAVNRELNNKVIELYNRLLSQNIIQGQADFCRKIDYETPSFAQVLVNKRSFPKSKVPILVTVFDLDRNYFDEIKYTGTEIGDKIKFIRESVGYGQRRFGKELGVTQATISTMESGVNKQPSFNFIWNLINKFKVNPYFIFSTDQIVFDTGKKFSNKAKVDNILSYAKKILEEGSKISI